MRPAPCPQISHVEYFHDHARIEHMLFDGALDSRQRYWPDLHGRLTSRQGRALGPRIFATQEARRLAQIETQSLRPASRPSAGVAWVIAEGYIPGESNGPAPAMTSHETACILNPNDAPAQVQTHALLQRPRSRWPLSSDGRDRAARCTCASTSSTTRRRCRVTPITPASSAPPTHRRPAHAPRLAAAAARAAFDDGLERMRWH